MSLATKLYDKETHSAARESRYRLPLVLLCIGLGLSVACMVFTPVTIGKIGNDQTLVVLP